MLMLWSRGVRRNHQRPGRGDVRVVSYDNSGDVRWCWL